MRDNYRTGVGKVSMSEKACNARTVLSSDTSWDTEELYAIRLKVRITVRRSIRYICRDK